MTETYQMPENAMSTDERFISPVPLPAARECEILNIIIEECAEIQHRACKALRFGLNEVQPGQDLNNAERLADEIGDLRGILNIAQSEGIVSISRIRSASTAKLGKLRRFMQTEPEGNN